MGLVGEVQDGDTEGWRVMRRSLVHNGRRMKSPIASASSVVIELNAVLVALTANQPRVLTLDDGTVLPSGPFEIEHPTLQAGMRAWVERQTHHPLGYVEQLYTFADRNRVGCGQRVVSISYLGLTRERRRRAHASPNGATGIAISPGRTGAPAPRRLLRRAIVPRLEVGGAADTRDTALTRVDGELRRRQGAPGTRSWCCSATSCCYEAGLVPKPNAAQADGRSADRACRCATTIGASWPPASPACAPRSNTGPSCSS